MTFLYSLFFWIHILFLQCFAICTVPYMTEPKTELRLNGFKTLWKPYTQLYTFGLLRRSSENVETTTPRTTYISIDGDLKTPHFLNDFYYDDRPRGTVEKRLILRQILVNSTKKLRFNVVTRKFETPSNTTTISATVTTTTVAQASMRQQNNPIGAYCYVCGLDEPGIPHGKCYDAFNNPQKTFIRRKLKIHCMVGTAQDPHKPKIWYGKLYRGGCFTRFTDVGKVYNEKGCRTKKPIVGKSYASKRFASLEKLLYGVDNGCVYSPHAALTPFSRAISLYVRYYVCVCRGKYCNQATSLSSGHVFVMIVILSLL